MDDEFDELSDETPTRTYLWNLSDLTAPRQFATYTATTEATDHNQYVRGNLAYQSNYRAALRIYPKDVVSHTNLANLLAHRGDYEQAVSHYELALEVNPHSTIALIGGIAVGDIDWVPDLEAQAWLVLLALSSQVLGWLLISVSLPRLPALLTSIVLMLQPVSAVFLAALLLSESPSAVQLLGVVVVWCGIIGSSDQAGWRLPAWIAGLASIDYGLHSLVFPDVASAAPGFWAVAAIGWGVSFLVITITRGRRHASPDVGLIQASER